MQHLPARLGLLTMLHTLCAWLQVSVGVMMMTDEGLHENWLHLLH